MGLGDKEESESSVVCSGCGKTMPSSLEYCNNCGKRLPTVTQPEKTEIPQERPLSTEGWPMVRRDAAYTGSDGSPVQAPLEKVWEFQAGGSIESWPALAYNMVFFGSKDKHLYALDAATGQKKWTFKTGKAIKRTPVVADGIVYVASEDKHLYAIDAQTGQKRWQFSPGNDISSPLAVGHDLVFFACKDKHIYAIDAQTGQKRWTFKGDYKGYSAPTLAEGKLLIIGYGFATSRGKFYAIDAVNGTLAWEQKGYGGFFGTRNCSPCLVSGNAILTHGPKDRLFKLDLESGKEEPSQPNIFGMLTKNERFLFVTPLGFGALMAYDLSTSRMAFTGFDWTAVIEGTFDFLGPSASLPVVGGEFAFVTVLQDKRLYGFNISKFMKRWEFKLAEKIKSHPVLAGGMVFVTSDKGKIHAFRGAKDPRATSILEYVAGEITNKPKFKAVLFEDQVMWPSYCSLCCGPKEKETHIGAKDSKGAIAFRGVPYCESCLKKVKKTFGAEQPAVKILKVEPPTIGFRNERYWAMFMETNRLR